MDYIYLIYFAISTLILYATTLLTMNDIMISTYETIHRESVWHIISFYFLLGIKTKIALSALISTQILFSIILCINEKNKRKISLLSTVSFISLVTYLFFGKAEALLLSSLLLSYFSLKNQIGTAPYVNFLLLLTSILDLSSLIVWLVSPLSKAKLQSSMISSLSYIDKEIFYSLNALIGYPLLIILLFSWALALLMSYKIKVKIDQYKVRITIGKCNEVVKQVFGKAFNLTNSILFKTRFAFSFSIIALLYMSFYSYMPAINPTGKFTNVDSIFYSNTLDEFEAVLKGTYEYGIFKNGYGGRRITSILLIFLTKNLLNINSNDTIKLSYFIASVFLVISTYVSLRLTLRDKLLSLLSIYLTTFSLQTVVGLYAGYLANWLACSLLILMSSLAISGVEERKMNRLALSVIFSILGLFTHPWSWFVYMMAFTLFFIGLIVFDKSTKRTKKISLLLIFSFLALGFSIDYTKQNLLGFLGGVQSDIQLMRSIRLTNLFLFPRNVNYTLQIYVGGYLNNYLIFFLSVIGISYLLKLNEKGSWFLVALSFMISAPIFFLNSNVQARLLYLMPLNIYSALGCTEVLKFARKKGINENLLLMLILLILANYSFRSVANLI